ncbi:Hypothetical predicted protein [Cloeon dipterum]|uniref:Caspase family p20 domain-containing protein n=1 Tax=Cloeon dipterum TaxID=197152 RepID=A0A8S1DAE7_9INSE|nr:Hypothetical predicted protein [Cloeon dipterum]
MISCKSLMLMVRMISPTSRFERYAMEQKMNEEDIDKTFGYLLNKQDNRARVWVLVIHHEFENTDDSRAGNQADVSNLRDTFTRRNCHFKDLKSNTKEEILSHLSNSDGKLFSLFAENGEDVETPDMFILFILSHGASGGTIFTDHPAIKPNNPSQPFEEYHTYDVWNGLKGIPQLQDSIKLIFFGPCRGVSGEFRLPATKETLDKNPVQNKSMWFSIGPNCENFVIFYSTVEAVRAQRNAAGSWLVTALCTELDSMSKDLDLIVFLTRVKRRICESTTIDRAIGQTPQLQYYKHNEFTVSSFPLKEKSDAFSKTAPDQLIDMDRFHFYTWKSTKHLPFRRGRALIFYDKNHASVAKEMQTSFQFLDFETRIYSASRLTKILKEVTSVHNAGLKEDGAIAICVLARLFNNAELGLTIATADDAKVAVNEITHSFIGTESKDLAGKPKLFFFMDGGCRSDGPLIGVSPANFTVEGNNHGGIFTFFGVAKSEKDNIVSGLINELQNPELKSGLSLQEAIVKLLRRHEEPSGEIQFQVVSTLSHLLDFQPCRNAYIVPKFMSEEAETSISFEKLATNMKDVAMKPNDRSAIRSWLLISGTGMGKSAATHELAKKLRETLSDTFLVIDFSFKKYSGYFRQLKIDSNGDFKPRPDSYIEFLEVVLEKDSERCKALKTKISERNVFLLGDGFNEICPEYEKIASELLRQVNEAYLPLWITTRIHGEQSIREKINLLEILDLCPLTREEQIKLLKIFLYKDDKECAALLDKFNGNGKGDFTGTPMQLKLIAEIGDEVQTFDGGLYSLYYHFVLSKIDFYLEDYSGMNRSHKNYESSLWDAMGQKIEATKLEMITTQSLQQRKIDLMSYICKEGHEKLFKLFFESKLKENFGDISTLLNTPFEYEFRNDTYKYYPLYAACFSSENIALHLLELGAQLDFLEPKNCRTEEDSTILHLAAKRNFCKIAKIIVATHPHLINKEDKHQRIPLDHAAKRGNLECLKILIENTASEHRLAIRKRALEIASIGGHSEMVLYLMGENLDVKKDSENTKRGE